MKKKFLVSAMALTLVAGLLGGCGNKKEDDMIKIGAIGPLTGPAATYGQSVKEGASLVEKEVNDKEVGGQAVLGRQNILPTPWLTERHGYDPTWDVEIKKRMI